MAAGDAFRIGVATPAQVETMIACTSDGTTAILLSTYECAGGVVLRVFDETVGVDASGTVVRPAPPIDGCSQVL